MTRRRRRPPNTTELMQRLLKQYREEVRKEVDMHDLARWALRKGWKLPEPINPLDRLAKQFALAARQETRVDDETGLPYRANHAYRSEDPNQTTLWIDIDEAPRWSMFKSLQTRRQQMVGDAVQLSLDAQHWNRVNPAENPIAIELDFGPDVDWRLSSPEENAG